LDIYEKLEISCILLPFSKSLLSTTE
jgi:hypothetical protein